MVLMSSVPDQDHPSHAPLFHVPNQRIVSIEHPCIVKNFDNGFKSLGGEAQIQHVLDHTVGDSLLKVGDKTHVYPEPVVGVSLRPHDVLAKKMSSSGVETRNILVRVTVPKWTGRKRKRGSNEPFATVPPIEQHRTSIKAPALLRQLRDNEGAYQVQALGMIRETHRFRSQPDYQMHSGDIPLLRELKTHVLHPTHPNLTNFRLDLNPFARGNAVYPLPPSFNAIEQPYHYKYQQAYGAVYKLDPLGQPFCESAYSSLKRVAEPLAPDAATVPLGPHPNLKLSGRQDDLVLRAVAELKSFLEIRPIASKRVFANHLPHYREDVLKEANQWAGYYFSAGPWRDVLIKFGVDPRSDPQYRVYQTMTFLVDRGDVAKSNQRGIQSMAARRRESSAAVGGDGGGGGNGGEGPMSHIFDGQSVPGKIKLWQICDIVDPVLYELLHTEELPGTCDVHLSGWYYPGTLAKARAIMKDKMKGLMMGPVGGVTASEEEYAVVAGLAVDGGAREEAGWQVGLSGRVVEMVREIRGAVKVAESKGEVRRKGKGGRGAGGGSREKGGVDKGKAGGVADGVGGAVIDLADDDVNGEADEAENLYEPRSLATERGMGGEAADTVDDAADDAADGAADDAMDDAAGGAVHDETDGVGKVAEAGGLFAEGVVGGTGGEAVDDAADNATDDAVHGEAPDAGTREEGRSVDAVGGMERTSGEIADDAHGGKADEAATPKGMPTLSGEEDGGLDHLDAGFMKPSDV